MVSSDLFQHAVDVWLILCLCVSEGERESHSPLSPQSLAVVVLGRAALWPWLHGAAAQETRQSAES